MNHVPSRHGRRGFTIMEMIGVISVMSLLMMLVVVTLVSMLRLGHDSSQRIAWQTTWHRLSLDFHADAHAARTADISADDSVLTFDFSPATTVEYRATGDGVERRQYSGEQIQASETYRLPEAYSAELSLRSSETGELGVIALSRAAHGPDGPVAVATQPLRIEAYINLDRRSAALAAMEKSP